MRRNGRPRKATGLLGALLVLVVACGDDDSTDEPADEGVGQVEQDQDDPDEDVDGGDDRGNDNCALVTAEEAVVLVGEPVGPPRRQRPRMRLDARR